VRVTTALAKGAGTLQGFTFWYPSAVCWHSSHTNTPDKVAMVVVTLRHEQWFPRSVAVSCSCPDMLSGCFRLSQLGTLVGCRSGDAGFQTDEIGAL
jgi:hypothetical protein